MVTDEKYDPTIEASILIKESKAGKITDINGRFSIDIIDNFKAVAYPNPSSGKGMAPDVQVYDKTIGRTTSNRI